MADLKATNILHYGDGAFDRVVLDKGTAGDAIEVGDFLIMDTAGAVSKMTGVTEDSVFAGVCGTLSKDADGPQELLVYTKCIAEVPMTSATYIHGAGLKYKTDGTLEDDDDANTIVWAWSNAVGTVTSTKVLVDVLALNKLFELNA